MSNEEKRINNKLLTHWEELRGDDDCPYESQLNPEDLKEVWHNCFIIEIEGPEDDPVYKYSYLGDSIIEAFGGDDLTGKDVYDSLIDPKDSTNHLLLEDITNNREPFLQESEFTNKLGILIKYRRCFLPLKEKDGTIKYLFGGMRWKAS